MFVFFPKLPKHLRLLIVSLLSKHGLRYLGPLIASGRSGMLLAIDPVVLRQTVLDIFELHPELVNPNSKYRHFIMRCVQEGNPTACYLESIRLVVKDRLYAESIALLKSSRHPSPKMSFALALFLIATANIPEGKAAMNLFKVQVVSFNNATRLYRLVFNDINKFGHEHTELTFCGWISFINHPPEREAGCSNCNTVNRCPRCCRWWSDP